MNTAQSAIYFEAFNLLLFAIAASLAIGSWSAQARDVLMQDPGFPLANTLRKS
jgi:hypothetical protein